MKIKSFLLVMFFLTSVVFAFGQTGGVKGKVRDARESSLAGVSVSARQNGKGLKTVVTDAKGDFLLENLEAGNYDLIFEKSGFNAAILSNVEVKKNKIRDLGGKRLILDVDPGSLVFIRGVVFDENGRSVRGARIEIERKQADGSYKRVSQTTSSYGSETMATGEFGFRFPPGATEYRVTASMKDASATEIVTVSNAAVYRLALTLKLSSK